MSATLQFTAMTIYFISLELIILRANTPSVSYTSAYSDDNLFYQPRVDNTPNVSYTSVYSDDNLFHQPRVDNTKG